MPYKKVTEQQLRFLEVDRSTFESLEQIKRSLETDFDSLMDRFYARILQVPELKLLFQDKETAARARDAQKRYWQRYFFASKFDQGQLEQAEQIAQAHLRIGLAPSWYMGGYCIMLNEFVKVACECHKNDVDKLSSAVQALNKLVFLDMNTVIDMYLESKNATMRDMLLRATTFTEDVTELCKQIAYAQQDLQAQLSPAVESAGITESVAQLSTRVRNLASRLDRFQDVDRLSTAHHREAKGFVSLVRQFVKSIFSPCLANSHSSGDRRPEPMLPRQCTAIWPTNGGPVFPRRARSRHCLISSKLPPPGS